MTFPRLNLPCAPTPYLCTRVLFKSNTSTPVPAGIPGFATKSDALRKVEDLVTDMV
jgi:hypothetical protein